MEIKNSVKTSKKTIAAEEQDWKVKTDFTFQISVVLENCLPKYCKLNYTCASDYQAKQC
jgi:hypothetical protein